MKAVAFEATAVEPLARVARAQVVTAQLFDEVLVAMNDAMAALDGGFAVESPSGACSSIQKLTSLFLRAMTASFAKEGGL
jgi:hypothetical protein